MSERGEPHSDPALKDSIRARVVQIMDTWRRGSRPDARQVLEMHPDLWSEPSAVLDLALAEYRLRRAAGEQVDTTRFAAQFSTYADYVKRILSVERALPDLDLEIRWPEPGDSYLEFKLLWLLGVGAVGRVYLARQETIADRPVALKLTPFGYDEAQTLGKLHHNNIVPVLSVHKDEKTGLAGVCMPYLGTSTLQEVVRLAWRKRENREQEPTPPLSVLAQAVACPDGIEPPEAPFGERPLWELCADYWEAVIHIGAGLCEGLAYVHSKGILHLDLKPSNVLLSPTGRPMLLDFNLAQDPARRAARLGGTVPYMAPEHFQQAFLAGPRDDHHQQLDARADLYSLGAVLFELCTGRLPHESTAGNFNDYLEEIALSHLRGAPPVRRVNSHLPEGLALLIDACLQNRARTAPGQCRMASGPVARITGAAVFQARSAPPSGVGSSGRHGHRRAAHRYRSLVLRSLAPACSENRLHKPYPHQHQLNRPVARVAYRPSITRRAQRQILRSGAAFPRSYSSRS
ncbi:MAG: hypothetical protein KatS3mg110_3928 [Pirellulaceae bacterium]|nr:MAG: hypothetical protein KatS3mg110_3928 [Pirellulaceae bacterium]